MNLSYDDNMNWRFIDKKPVILPGDHGGPFIKMRILLGKILVDLYNDEKDHVAKLELNNTEIKLNYFMPSTT